MITHLAKLLVILSALCLQNAAAQASSDWEYFKKHFVSDEGRVIDTYNNKISHSEGQGWGMLFAEANNDQASFDRIWRWTRKNLARNDHLLFSWRYEPAHRPRVKDPNNASDGDLLIAWALQRAARRWNNSNYATASAAIRADIHTFLIKDYAGFTVLLPGLTGFTNDNSIDINLSYWVIPALISFAALEPEKNWSKLVTDGQKLLAASQFGEYGLPTDWIRLSADGALAPSPKWPTRFGYDAVRIPMYFIWGSALTPELRQPFSAYWQSSDPVLPWVDVVTGEKAPYAASSGIRAVRALVYDDLSFLSQSPQPGDDYYSTSLLLLSKLAALPQ